MSISLGGCVLMLATLSLLVDANHACIVEECDADHTSVTSLLQKKIKVANVNYQKTWKSTYQNADACLNKIEPLLERPPPEITPFAVASIVKRDVQRAVYLELGSNTNVKTICETGFASGKSAALWLCANPDAHLYTFDLYIPDNGVAVLQEQEGFRERLTYFEGDSTELLPAFASDPKTASVYCDIMVADGGHFGDVPWIDLQNFAKIAAKEPDRQHTFLLDEVYMFSPLAMARRKQNNNKNYKFTEEDGCCPDVTSSYEKALRLGIFDTNASYCMGYGDGTKYPIVGENTLKTTYPLGGFCVLHFNPEYLKSLA